MVVAAIIAILAGILVPLIINQVDETRKSRALADCKSMCTAILAFRKDTGKWPYYLPDDCTQTYLTIQGSGNAPADATTDWQISLNDIALTLILNIPSVQPPVDQSCYNNKAKNYFPQDAPDPWGNAYIVNAANFAVDNAPVWVISAGPNGALDTTVNSATLNDLAADGDDIGVRIK
jgi:general secretion pathway protein G